MRRPQLAPDWCKILDELMNAGVTRPQIGKHMGCDLTLRMIAHYKTGAQPTYWRGACLLDLWSSTMGKKLELVPMTAVVRGHRVPNNRDSSAGPRLQSLPQWPPVAAPVAKPVKRAKKVKEPA